MRVTTTEGEMPGVLIGERSAHPPSYRGRCLWRAGGGVVPHCARPPSTAHSDRYTIDLVCAVREHRDNPAA